MREKKKKEMQQKRRRRKTLVRRTTCSRGSLIHVSTKRAATMPPSDSDAPSLRNATSQRIQSPQPPRQDAARGPLAATKNAEGKKIYRYSSMQEKANASAVLVVLLTA